MVDTQNATVLVYPDHLINKLGDGQNKADPHSCTADQDAYHHPWHHLTLRDLLLLTCQCGS